MGLASPQLVPFALPNVLTVHVLLDKYVQMGLVRTHLVVVVRLFAPMVHVLQGRAVKTVLVRLSVGFVPVRVQRVHVQLDKSAKMGRVFARHVLLPVQLVLVLWAKTVKTDPVSMLSIRDF